MRAAWPRSLLRFGILLLVLSVLCMPQVAKTHAQGTAMLAVIDADGNLSIYDANGKNPILVTKDAQAGVKTYAWPTWSTDGRLAFFGSSHDPQDPFSLGVFVLDKVTSGATPKTAYTSTNEVYT